MLKEKEDCTKNPFRKEFPKGKSGREGERQAVLFSGVTATSDGGPGLAHEDLCFRSPVGAARRQSERRREPGVREPKLHLCDPEQGTWLLCLCSYL